MSRALIKGSSGGDGQGVATVAVIAGQGPGNRQFKTDGLRLRVFGLNPL